MTLFLAVFAGESVFTDARVRGSMSVTDAAIQAGVGGRAGTPVDLTEFTFKTARTNAMWARITKHPD